MRAAIVAIGDELTLGESLDTNSAWLAARLRERSVHVIEHRTLSDDAQQIGETISDLAARSDLIICTGGLGPTADDLTRTGLGVATTPGKDLVQDDYALRRLRTLYRRRNRPMPETNLVQTMRPSTATMIPNPNGTAMGLADTIGACRVFALPGPPREMQPMFESAVAPILPDQNEANVALTRFVHAYGIAESEAAQRLGDLLARNRSPQLGITVSRTILTVRIRAAGARSTVEQQLDDDTLAVRQALEPYVFGIGDDTLASAIGALVLVRNATLATAESCTGGLLGAEIVDVPGSSAYYTGGWVTYSNEMKARQLNISEQLLEQHGAVSAEVAGAMAAGAMRNAETDFALSITGVAGPDGGTADKPVGLVYIGLTSNGGAVEVRRFEFVGDRTMIRQRSVLAALQMLRFKLLGVGDQTRLLWETTQSTPARRNRRWAPVQTRVTEYD